MTFDIHPVALVVADLVIIGGFLGYALRPLRGAVRFLLDMREDLTIVKEQVLPNHGTSIRDVADRMENRQEEMHQRQVDLIEEQKATNKRLDRHIEAHLRIGGS